MFFRYWQKKINDPIYRLAISDSKNTKVLTGIIIAKFKYELH